MNYKHNPAVKIISAFVLFFFMWSFGGVIDIAYAAKSGINGQVASSKVNAKKTKEQNSAEKFQKTIEGIEQIISGMKNKSESDINVHKGKLRTKKSEIETIDIEIKKQFADTEKKLKDEGLPSEILDRHYKFVRHYEDNLNELKKNLEKIDKAKNRSEIEKEIQKTKAHLEKVNPPKRHKPLDPGKLPHRVPEIKEFPIVEKEQADLEAQKPILLASAGSLDGLLAQNTTAASTTIQSPPTAADSAETIEIQLTPEITAKAIELGKNPVKIYEWVRNNFQYEPYYGSLKGAQQTLQAMAGNDFDQASLLIALLRASNIPARYVSGTIELPIERLMNWVGGITNPVTAAQVLATAGVPGKLLTEGGKIKYAQFEHCWVEAYVDMFPSMGSIHKQGNYWTPIDPSFKEMKVAESLNIAKVLPFDETTYINTADDMPPVLSYIYSLKDYYNTNYDYEFSKIFHVTLNIKEEFGIFLGTLPYKTISEQRYAEISDSKRHKIRLALSSADIYDEGTSFSVEKTLPEIAGKKLTLSYAPASSNDQAVINKYGGLLQTPAYLINVKPEIKLDNTTILSGPSIGLGSALTLTTELSGPNMSRNIETTDIRHGISYAIGISLLNYSGMQQIGQVDTLRVLEGTLHDSINILDSRAGELLYNIALEYFTQFNGISKSLESIMHVLNTKQPSVVLVSADATYTEVFGTVVSPPIMKGLVIDAIRLACSPLSLDGDMLQRKAFIQQRGLNSSYLEHKILENLLEEESISAVKALQIAAKNGIPIYTINQGNITGILPSLTISGSDKIDIQNAVNAGKDVVVSRDNITLQDWTGVGYIVRDPVNGNGSYMISNSFGGGGTVQPSNPAFNKEQKVAWFVGGQKTDYWADPYTWWFVEEKVVEMVTLPIWNHYGYLTSIMLNTNKTEFLLLAANHPLTWILHYSGHGAYDHLQIASGEDQEVHAGDIKNADVKIVFLNSCLTGKYDTFVSPFGIDQRHKVNGVEINRKEVLLGWSYVNWKTDMYALEFWIRMGRGMTVGDAINDIKNKDKNGFYDSCYDEIKVYPDGIINTTTLIP